MKPDAPAVERLCPRPATALRGPQKKGEPQGSPSRITRAGRARSRALLSPPVQAANAQADDGPQHDHGPTDR